MSNAQISDTVDSVAKTLIDILRDVLPPVDDVYALHEPLFEGNEWKYVKNCLDTGWVSSVGSYVDDFEKKVAEISGTKYGIACANGTAALHICLKLVGVEQGDEVLIPAMTFIATANAASYCGAVPHFVDISYDTLGIDPSKLSKYLSEIVEIKDGKPHNKHTGRRLAAIVPVHIFGHPVDMDTLCSVADNYGIPVVEDAAESIGSLYKGRPAGSLGKVAAISFNGNKIITTGGGGAIVTNDEALAKRAKHLTTTARLPHKWVFDHDEVGYNYRMPNINAALGLAQLEQLDTFLPYKRKLAAKYDEAFAKQNTLSFVKEPQGSTGNYWLNAVLLDKELSSQRDDLLEQLNHAGYLCRPAWKLMNHLTIYKDCPHSDLSVAEDIEARLINLPSSVKLGRGG